MGAESQDNTEDSRVGDDHVAHYNILGCIGINLLSYAKIHAQTPWGPSVVLDYLRHLIRGTETNLNRKVASPSERKHLRSLGITGFYVHNLLAYRRSAMQAMRWPMIITFLASISAQFDNSQFGRQVLNTRAINHDPRFSVALTAFQLLNWAVVLITLFSVIMLQLGLWSWTNYRRSRWCMAVSWFVFVFGPYLVSLVPYTAILGPAIEASLGIPREIAGLLVGLYFFAQLAPTMFSLFPSMIRGALIIRYLFPHSPVPAAFCAIVPLVAVPASWVTIVLLYQMLPSLTLLIGLFLYASSTLLFIVFQRSLSKPIVNKGAYTLTDSVRYVYYLVVTVAFALIISYFMTSVVQVVPFQARNAIGRLINPMFVIRLVSSFITTYYLTNVFSSDMMLRVMIKAERVDKMLKSGNHEDLAETVAERQRELEEIVPLD